MRRWNSSQFLSTWGKQCSWTEKSTKSSHISQSHKFQFCHDYSKIADASLCHCTQAALYIPIGRNLLYWDPSLLRFFNSCSHHHLSLTKNLQSHYGTNAFFICCDGRGNHLQWHLCYGFTCLCPVLYVYKTSVLGMDTFLCVMLDCKRSGNQMS